MRTMFVQLRRVVYLLVLLQCCVCVACAATASDVEHGPSASKSTEVGNVDQELSDTITVVYEHIVNIRACMSMLMTGADLCKGNYTRAAAVAKKIKELQVEANGEKKNKREWIERNNVSIRETINEFDDVAVVLVDMDLVDKACDGPLGNVEDVTMKLENAQKRFLEVHQNKPHETEEIMRLKENSIKANQSLFNLRERFKSAGDELKPIWELTRVMGGARKDLQALVKFLGSEPGLVIVSEETREEELKRKGKDREIAVTKELEEARKKAKENLPLEQEGPVEEEGRIEDGEQPSGESEGTRTDDEKTPEANKEEKENKAETEKEKEKEQADEEETGRESTGNKEEGEQEQEKPVKEESKRPEIGGEQVIRAIQERDNSVSPALVHGPLLLLLLCVLGCSLVC
ncbi:uncharacterized protein TM35_000301760 [Trypanosoma theileri]|uniref:Trypanosoma glutamic acid/alanine-rich protein domain-containing protein n=1 Tax=Trypanosoma theileri TaxID=67003 RepID=A0A1X0NN38_9TRYP|nr:uncharacterized protein TM35_000301760 [Trypanosoma theileri]ORC86136.1 hypothetical protein TM35_000301760 [Trypanosoma theileri]